MVHVPSLAGFCGQSERARESEFIDNKSGVSLVGITAYENLLSTERRALRAGDEQTTHVYQTLWVSYLLLRVKRVRVYEGGRRSSLCSTKLNCICDTFSPVTFKIEARKPDKKQL
jgi:hypothetical protein